MRRRHWLAPFRSHAILATTAVLMVLPALFVVIISLKTRKEFAADPFGLPSSLNLNNYLTILEDQRMIGFVANSIITTTVTMILVIFGSTLAGYALARIKFRGAGGLFIFFLLTDSVPLIVLLIPLYILVARLGLFGTRLEIILPYTAMMLGLAILVMRAFFRSIPSDLEDAAVLDGASTLQMLRYVMLPLVRQGVIVVAIFTFVAVWNEYLLAAILLPSQDLFTLPAGIAALFTGKYANNWPAISAGVVFSAIPATIIFLLAQDRIVDGWTKGR